MSELKNVYVDGVFDLFHEGHVRFLKQAASYGRLIVGIHSDDFVRSYKRTPYIREPARYEIVQACRYVDDIIPGVGILTDKLLDRYKIDLVLHGDDLPWPGVYKYYKCALLKGIFQYLPYTNGVSTSDIISEIRERLSLTA